MEMKDILSVGLSAEDFDTILEGLDAIPEKGLASDMTFELLKSSTIGGDRNKQDNYKREMEARFRKREKDVSSRKDDLTILKSKIILLKRLLAGNDAVRQVNSIITPYTPPV